ncbi:MAG: GNAT family N-acetyltransferase, partial [Pseudomonadota bacterium]|nr:GNAT family N-acetyltransferase [Pseudomonadota bacterium]
MIKLTENQGEELKIKEVREADPEMLGAINALLPQLSSSFKPLDLAGLQEIAESPATRLLVASIGGRVVGNMTLVLFPVPTGRRAWIEDVVVDEAIRG